MIKSFILITILLGQSIADEFVINWLRNQNTDNSNEVYQIPQNQTSSSNPTNNGGTGTIYSIEQHRVLTAESESPETPTTTVQSTPTTTEQSTPTTMVQSNPTTTAQSTATPTTTEPSTTVDTTNTDVDETPVSVTAEDIDSFRQKMRMFAANFYNQVLKTTGKNANIIYSPVSITHAMGMVNTGARGNSSNQIKESLHYMDKTDDSYLDALFGNTTSSKFEDSTGSEVTKTMVARSYIHDTLEVKAKFLKAIQAHYHSDIKHINFHQPVQARIRINQWVEEKTNDLIKELLPPGILNVYTRLVLVNAIYFKVPWTNKFSEKAPEDFMTPEGKVTVPFMNSVVRCRYQENDLGQFVAIPYKDGETSFFIIAPDSDEVMGFFERQSFFEQYLGSLNQYMAGWTSRKIHLHMPMFTVEQNINVKMILKSMGITDIFGQHTADLSGIAPDLYVSDFLHKAKLSVDEKGTEAAAASAVMTSARTIVKDVNINRPFIFGVIESTGDILFMGKVVNPSGK